MQPFFEYSAEVKQAISSNQPILALESTIISHGMPYPNNLEMALTVEQIARDLNVVPATIAIMGGKIKIGLTEKELTELAEAENVFKASRRDIPFFLGKKYFAGTTVAATLFCAAKANIKVFATGGIGGVHRGDDQDISSDLTELAQTPIAVVCAGAKSILDLPRTLEFLETMSVPVIGYGTDFLPAFYTDTTPYRLSHSIDNVKGLARMLNIHWQLGMNAGVLVTNPIPTEFAISADVIEPVIQQALTEAKEQKIIGKAITPFLLKKILHLTEGKSLTANIALIKNNVRLGAELAAEISYEKN